MSKDFDRYFKGVEIPDLEELSKKSKGWFNAKVKELRRNPIQHRKIAYGDIEHTTKRLSIGRMYIFEYDPKTKEKLPIWDKYPLALPFSSDGRTFYAINLHYLPYKHRAWMLSKLLKVYNMKNAKSKMKLSWEIISGISRISPTDATKRYLPDHIMSPLRVVPASEWAKAIVLPFHRFIENKKKM